MGSRTLAVERVVVPWLLRGWSYPGCSVGGRDSNDNVYDVYYDVHEYEDTDTGSPGVANPEASWAVGIG